jgi:hypothetical protein
MRYFFHYRSDVRYFPDTEGGDFANLSDAMQESRLSACELMSLDHGEPDQSFALGAFEIAAADGTILAVSQFDEETLRGD